jgi:prepilin-type N-terminal cleavage/methylation domain-containing protein/prepilin-type processing-associated H-X9-DG protein
MSKDRQSEEQPSVAPRGFTLVELLVVIAIIGVLVALLLPAVQAAREAARRTECRNKLHQIGIALHNYHSSHSAFPYGAADGDCEANTEPRRQPHTWRTMLLPFLENQAVYDELQKVAAASVTTGCYPRRPWDDSPMQLRIMSEYICPSDAEPWVRSDIAPWSGPSPASIASYQGNAGPVATGPADWGVAESCGMCVGSIACPCIFGNTLERGRGFYHGHNPDGPGMLDMWPNDITLGKVPDGSSKTIHVGETHSLVGRIGCRDQANWLSTWGVASTVWGINHGAPLGENWQSHCNYRSFHEGGANFLFVDSSVRFLESAISPALLGNLGGRKDANIDDEYSPPQG